LAEEVHDPRRTIPRAIILSLQIALALYAAVAFIAVASVGAEAFAAVGGAQSPPLVMVARRFRFSPVGPMVTVGAIAAMLGVLLNLVLGLSRVVLAMGRRRDIPAVFARIGNRATPAPAVLLVGALIAGLVLVGDVGTTWSLSAFAVLVYYAITNLAALRLDDADRRFPRFIAWCGLGSCLSLAFWVEPRTWLIGLASIAAGLAWHGMVRRYRSARG
jgi:APA family basic amino acid/polyamine antiporter